MRYRHRRPAYAIGLARHYALLPTSPSYSNAMTPATLVISGYAFADCLATYYCRRRFLRLASRRKKQHSIMRGRSSADELAFLVLYPFTTFPAHFTPSPRRHEAALAVAVQRRYYMRTLLRGPPQYRATSKAARDTPIGVTGDGDRHRAPPVADSMQGAEKISARDSYADAQRPIDCCWAIYFTISRAA